MYFLLVYGKEKEMENRMEIRLVFIKVVRL